MTEALLLLRILSIIEVRVMGLEEIVCRFN
jgi:hypothetical protein